MFKFEENKSAFLLRIYTRCFFALIYATQTDVHDIVKRVIRPGWYTKWILIDPTFGLYVRFSIFKASALWADAFYKSKCPYVCLSVCVFTFWGTV